MGVGDGALGVDIQRERMDSRCQIPLWAFRHLGRGVVRAARAVPRAARRRGLVITVDGRRWQQASDPVGVCLDDAARHQPPVDGFGHVAPEFAVAGQQRLTRRVGLPDQLRGSAVRGRVDDQARGLILHQRTLFLDDQQFVAAQRKVGEGLRLQRPDLRDLEHADTKGFEISLQMPACAGHRGFRDDPCPHRRYPAGLNRYGHRGSAG